MATTIVERTIPSISEAEPDTTLSRLVRGVVAGEISGAVFALVTVWFTTSIGLTGDAAFLMMSTIAKGGGQVDASSDVATGVLVHLALSALFGAIFALILPKMRTNGTLLLSAGVYGLVVYLVNFRILSPVFFPAFQDANQPFEVLVHLVYGQLLAVFFLSRGVRRGEPRFDWR
ncbi:MAG: hypothetical protein KatS3mg008_1739 [Acidimicrobiales bacterium]|nr:MAG: hypothetical protein KatS3mg008_1739 [Acidimicrobiales bacterium]